MIFHIHSVSSCEVYLVQPLPLLPTLTACCWGVTHQPLQSNLPSCTTACVERGLCLLGCPSRRTTLSLAPTCMTPSHGTIVIGGMMPPWNLSSSTLEVAKIYCWLRTGGNVFLLLSKCIVTSDGIYQHLCSQTHVPNPLVWTKPYMRHKFFFGMPLVHIFLNSTWVNWSNSEVSNLPEVLVPCTGQTVVQSQLWKTYTAELLPQLAFGRKMIESHVLQALILSHCHPKAVLLGFSNLTTTFQGKTSHFRWF